MQWDTEQPATTTTLHTLQCSGSVLTSRSLLAPAPIADSGPDRADLFYHSFGSHTL
ncbi:hypothetical protein PISMIDRAFT_674839 [Pisolithus microcarpus 441]|uniref:Uncharacterized protein n=1 Tax=Pisolithus microcarpus 441 TaxID=765257 RepID=A0A0C9YR20_9AGAM|nr:hypothetical protein PISMIDRAFT_674839 [Pisolithus microcarpus 441]